MAPPPDPTLSPFPTTHHSLVAAAGATDPEARRTAVDALIRMYWRPAYGRLRLKWQLQPADAEDLVQEFFAGLLDGEIFAHYDPHRARFRTYLRSCVDRFAANARRGERRLKRGGGAVHLSLDFAEAERELGAAAPPDPDAWFDREWVRALLTHGVEELRHQCVGTPTEIRFRVFESYDLLPPDGAGRPGYRDLAARFDIPVTQVTNHLAWARRELRRLVLTRLAEVTGSDAELRDEAEELFGGPRDDVA
ncbi:MAG TPA: sigma factor [Gemmatimonadales bacterium]|nr:sigma factor [Gemmatimonadales bacterium]